MNKTIIKIIILTLIGIFCAILIEFILPILIIIALLKLFN